jgi:hypothetical protein
MRLGWIALVLLAAWPTRADEVAGHYYLRNVQEVGSELLLKPDGTFEFMLAYGAADYHAQGAWRRDNDSVVLDSVDKNDPPFRLAHSLAAKGEGIHVWVNAPDGAPAEHIDVILKTANGVVKGRTTHEGEVYFGEAQQPREAFFEVRVYGVRAGPIPLNPAHNEFHFEINGEAITQTPFKNERLKIDGKALILKRGDDAPMRYERQ